MKKIILVFCALVSVSLLIFIISFDTEEPELNIITAEGKCSLSVPKYLSATDRIDPSAFLQLKNEQEQFFILVYEKTDSVHSLMTFFKDFSERFISKVDRGNMTRYYPEKINGLDALIGNIRGNVNETEVHYRIAVFQSGNRFFTLMAGTTEKSHGQYDDVITEIIRSFRAI